MSWLTVGKDRVTLHLHIQPGAKKTEVVGPHGDALKIRLAAPPVDGKANAVLIAFLVQRLGVSRQAIVLKSGHGARIKQISVAAVREEHVRERLLDAL
jgi:uncharacterized protein (TIGR00251 family)